MSRLSPLSKRSGQAALFSAALLLSPLLFATVKQDPPSLVPYTASYLAKIGNIPISGSATVNLAQNRGGDWTLSVNARFLIYKILGHSQFSYTNGQISPQDYLVKTSILGQSRTTTIDFNWNKKLADSRNRNKRWHVPLQRKDLDMISFQQQLQLDVSRGLKAFSYQIIDKDERGSYSFRYEKDEFLKTSAGLLRTARLIRERDHKKKKRTTYVWLARDWNDIPVQIQHLEKGKSYLLALKSAVVNQKNVHGIIFPQKMTHEEKI